MGTITDAFSNIWRDYVTAGVPASGDHEPEKSEIRALGPVLESAIATAALGGFVSVSYATKAELDADLAHAANSVGLVYADADSENTDIYVKVGTSGNGSWTNTGSLHSLVDGLLAEDRVAVAAVVGEQEDLDERLINLELALLDNVGQVYTFGNVLDMEGAGPSISGVGGANVVLNDPAPLALTGRKIEFIAHAIGTAWARVWTFDAPTFTFTLHAEQACFCTATGHQAFYRSLDIPLGAFVGFVGSGVVGLVVSTGAAVLQYTGGNAASTSFVDNTGATNDGQFGFKVTATSAVPRASTDDGGVVSREYSGPPPGILKPELASGEPVAAFLGGNGQSEMAGNAAAISTRQEYGSMGFANYDDTIVALDADTIGGNERPIYGMAAYYNLRRMVAGLAANRDGDRPLIAGTNATGGQTLEMLSKEFDPGGPNDKYTAGIEQVTAAKAYADGLGVDFLHLGRGFYQGPADAAVPTAEAAYEAALIDHAENYDADSRLAVPGDYARVTYVTQTLAKAVGHSAGDVWAIARAQVAACRASPLLVAAFPEYILDFSDTLHPTAFSTRLAGAYFARAAMLREFEPMWIIDHYIDGGNLVLVYPRETVFDYSDVPPQTNAGFVVRNESGVIVNLQSVKTVRNTVVLTPSAAPVPGFELDYAQIISTGKGAYVGGAGNLRDRWGDTESFEGRAMHNFALADTVVFA